MPITNISIYGLDEVKEYINPDRIKKELSIGVGLAVLQLHSALKTSVYAKYNVKQDKIESALVGKVAMTQTTGRNFILNGLEYRSSHTDLAKFPYTKALGNINLGAKRPGMVHTVSVRRGSAKVVYGKDHRGGFTQRNGRYGVQMFERKSKARFPLRILFGPSVVQMLNTSFEHDPKVKAVLNNLEQTIIDNFIT